MFVDIVVRKRIHEQGYYRSNHDVESSQNWNYRVYLTNVSIWSNGVASPDWGGFGSVMDITVHRDNTLIGLNLLVSVEWDLALTDLATLEGTINDFSAFLYNATDGQFFVEVAQITDRRELWDDSDIRISADGNHVADVPHVRGAFLGQDVWGSAMKMSRDNGSKTYAQQFGRYGLSLGEEYRNGGSAVCTRNVNGRSAFGSGRSRASCIMWNAYNANKICSRHAGNPHVRGTNQGNEACWDTIVDRYDFDSRWNIRTPTSRGTIPGTIRYSGGSGGSSLRAAFMMPKIYRRLRPDGHRLIGELTLMVRDRGGAPVTGVVVKTREPGGSWLVQGTTGEFGNRTMAGIHVGDRLRLEGGSDAVYEQDIPSGISGALSVNVPF